LWWKTYRQANVMLRINNWCWIQTIATREDVGRVRRRDAIEASQTDNLQATADWRTLARAGGKGRAWKGLAHHLGPGIGPLRVRGAGTAGRSLLKIPFGFRWRLVKLFGCTRVDDHSLTIPHRRRSNEAYISFFTI
jgi:hypothetical protein